MLAARKQAARKDGDRAPEGPNGAPEKRPTSNYNYDEAGNMAAFDILLAKYRKPIIHFMYRMVHNQAVAEELAQEVFLRVYRSRETYRA